MARDLYDVLGISSTASDAEIKAAYRELSKKYHPDKNRDDPGATTKFTEVTEAYKILIDPDKRAEYDESLPVVVTVVPGIVDFGVLKSTDPSVTREVVLAWEDRPPFEVRTPVNKGTWWSLGDAAMGVNSVTYALHGKVSSGTDSGLHTSHFDIVVDGQTHQVRLTVLIPAPPKPKPSAPGPSKSSASTSATGTKAPSRPSGVKSSSGNTGARPRAGTAAKRARKKKNGVTTTTKALFYAWVVCAVLFFGGIAGGTGWWIWSATHHPSGPSDGAVINYTSGIKLNSGYGFSFSDGSVQSDPYGTYSSLDLHVILGSLYASSVLTGPYSKARATYAQCADDVNAQEEQAYQQVSIPLKHIKPGDYLCAYVGSQAIGLVHVTADDYGHGGKIEGITFDLTLWAYTP